MTRAPRSPLIALIAIALLALAGCATPQPSDHGASNSSSSESLVPVSAAGATTTHASTPSSSASLSTTSAPKTGKGTGGLRGVVVDEAIHPILGANVTIDSLRLTSTTNADGAFAFKDLQPGAYFLTVQSFRYLTSQVSATVKAGVDSPDAIQVVLQANASRVPSVDSTKIDVFVSSSYCTPVQCGHVIQGQTPGGLGTDVIAYQWDAAPTAVQAELDWDPVTPFAEDGEFRCSVSGDTGHSESILVAGASPLVVRLPGSVPADAGGLEPARSLYCNSGPDSATSTLSVWANQKLQVIVTVFHNFTPRDDWVFSRDGDYPVPA